jgi:hypothetical protein
MTTSSKPNIIALCPKEGGVGGTRALARFINKLKSNMDLIETGVAFESILPNQQFSHIFSILFLVPLLQ